MDIIIKNARLLDKEGLFDILIQGQYIKNIEPKLEAAKAVVVNGEGCVAMPGLVNAHTHAAMSLLRGYADDMPLMSWLNNKIWPAETKLNDDFVYWGTMLGALEMIKSGTTCFADMYMHLDSVAKAVEESGLRASLSDVLFNEETLTKQPANIKNWHGAADGRIQIMLGPHSLYVCSPKLLQDTVRMAQKLDVGVHIHMAETLDEENIIRERYNMRLVAFAESTGLFGQPLLAAHMVHVNDSDMTIMQPYLEYISAVNNPCSNMKLSSGSAPVAQMIKLGLNIAIGTDSAASNNSLDMLSEIKISSLLNKLQSGQPIVSAAKDVLDMATINGSKACLFDKVGKLQEGYKADIILVDLQKPHLTPCHNIASQLVYAASGQDVKTNIVDGHILMQDYKMAMLDEEKIMAEASRCAYRMTS